MCYVWTKKKLIIKFQLELTMDYLLVNLFILVIHEVCEILTRRFQIFLVNTPRPWSFLTCLQEKIKSKEIGPNSIPITLIVCNFICGRNIPSQEGGTRVRMEIRIRNRGTNKGGDFMWTTPFIIKAYINFFYLSKLFIKAYLKNKSLLSKFITKIRAILRREKFES